MPRHVTLVCGPPCAGKTTYVKQHAKRGDVVLDFDAIAHTLGSEANHDHSEEIWGETEALIRSAIARIGLAEDVTAWVIRCAPRRAEREMWAARLRADETVVLIPPVPLLMQRARFRPSWTKRAIRRWFTRYTVAS